MRGCSSQCPCEVSDLGPCEFSDLAGGLVRLDDLVERALPSSARKGRVNPCSHRRDVAGCCRTVAPRSLPTYSKALAKAVSSVKIPNANAPRTSRAISTGSSRCRSRPCSSTRRHCDKREEHRQNGQKEHRDREPSRIQSHAEQGHEEHHDEKGEGGECCFHAMTLNDEPHREPEKPQRAGARSGGSPPR